MKTILALLLGITLTITARAQVGTFYAVTFYATNSPQVLGGWPQWEPAIGGVRALGTTNGPVLTNEVLFAWVDVNALISTNQAAFSAYQQAQYTASPAGTNYAAWLSLYNQIPLGISDTSNRMVTLTNLYSSWRSGTNSAAQTNAIITSVIQNDYYTWVYMNQIIKYLSKLGPGLQSIYNPASDPTQGQ